MALTDSLVEYWPLDEASGDGVGAHAGLTLTDNNTVTSATGKVYALARDFEATTLEHLQRSDEAALSMGNIDFTVACWAQLESKGADRALVVKGDTNDREYRLGFFAAADRIHFGVASATGPTNPQHINADTYGSPALATWFLVIGWHDAAADTINIQIDNGAVDTDSYTFGTYDGTAVFNVGYDADGLFWDGLVGPVMLWKRVLTSDERNTLWNGGAGLTYAGFTPSGGATRPPLRRTLFGVGL